ncbi:MAG: DMT family transporter [Acetobacteraceae bacterium]|nr:DMT family transporter [Acetobacteraceae bacterium]
MPPRRPPISADLATARARTLGALFLLVTILGWGLNWPILKSLLAELPPLTARGWAGVWAMAGLLFAAWLARERISVPEGAWGRLLLYALLNVTAWMGCATVGLLWIGAGEGAIIAYTMPAWAALLAWPMLGERLTAARIAALVLAMGGVVVLLAGNLSVGRAALPGVAIILSGAVLFAFGTILTKKSPLDMPPLALVGWQVGLGCLPLLVAGFLLETADFAALSPAGWAAMVYMAVLPLCLCYLAWFAALRRLPAGAAAIGTLLTPVVGVLAGALMLGEPLGLREVAALLLTLGGILLALRT